MIVCFYEVFLLASKGHSEFDAMGDGLAALAFLIFLPVSFIILLLFRFGALRLAKRGFLYLPVFFILLSVAFTSLIAGALLSS